MPTPTDIQQKITPPNQSPPSTPSLSPSSPSLPTLSRLSLSTNASTPSPPKLKASVDQSTLSSPNSPSSKSTATRTAAVPTIRSLVSSHTRDPKLDWRYCFVSALAPTLKARMIELLETSPYLLGDDDELDITTEVIQIVVNEIKGSLDVATVAGLDEILIQVFSVLNVKEVVEMYGDLVTALKILGRPSPSSDINSGFNYSNLTYSDVIISFMVELKAEVLILVYEEGKKRNPLESSFQKGLAMTLRGGGSKARKRRNRTKAAKQDSNQAKELEKEESDPSNFKIRELINNRVVLQSKTASPVPKIRSKWYINLDVTAAREARAKYMYDLLTTSHTSTPPFDSKRPPTTPAPSVVALYHGTIHEHLQSIQYKGFAPDFPSKPRHFSHSHATYTINSPFHALLHVVCGTPTLARFKLDDQTAILNQKKVLFCFEVSESVIKGKAEWDSKSRKMRVEDLSSRSSLELGNIIDQFAVAFAAKNAKRANDKKLDNMLHYGSALEPDIRIVPYVNIIGGISTISEALSQSDPVPTSVVMLSRIAVEYLNRSCIAVYEEPSILKPEDEISNT